MNENTKVAIKVEYECDGKRKVCFGEIYKNKLEELEESENFDAGDENYILMENDGNVHWVYKESVISIERLGVKSSVFERPRVKDYTNNNADTGICLSNCE